MNLKFWVVAAMFGLLVEFRGQHIEVVVHWHAAAAADCKLESFRLLHIMLSATDSIPQLSAMDVSAWTMMKGAAKCDNLCELQNSANQ